MNKVNAIRNYIRREFDITNEQHEYYIIASKAFKAGISYTKNPEKFLKDYPNLYGRNDYDDIAP